MALKIYQKGGPKGKKGGKKSTPKSTAKPTGQKTKPGNKKSPGRPKGSKNKNKKQETVNVDNISKRDAAKRLGKGAWEGTKWVGKKILPILGVKEIADQVGLTDLVFPSEIPENFKDYKINTGDLPGTNNRSNPNTNKSNKYRFGGHSLQSRGVGGRKVPGMYQDGGALGKNRRYQQGQETPSVEENTGQMQMQDVFDKPSHNWNDKLTRLSKKRTKRKDKGKSTKGVQRRINKEYKKINP